MTIQVGMVGSNGIVIAGDTRWTHNSILQANQFWSSGTHGTNSTKIVTKCGRGISVSAANDMDVAWPLALQIANGLPQENYRDPVAWIENKASEILHRKRTERGDPQARLEAHCLIMVRHPSPNLFRFQFANVDGAWGPFCQEMNRFAIAGATINAAIFWPEVYYNTFPYSLNRMPVHELIPLAAHTIVTAHRLNPNIISGLEVVFCDETGIHRLSQESAEKLESAAHGWDQQFGKIIFGHSQEFTFKDSE